MTVDEAKSAIEELKAQGLTDEGIAASLYSMYQDDKIDLDQFGALVKLVGYELSDEFMAMSDEDKKAQEVGEFGMSDDDLENNDDTQNTDDAQNDDSSNNAQEDNSNNDDDAKQDEEENPFEKDYDKKSSDEEDEEMKKMFNFK